MLKFRRVEPASPLRHLIQGYWQIEAGYQPELLDLVPDGYPEIAFLLQNKMTFTSANQQPMAMPWAGVIGQLTNRFISILSPHSKIIFIKMYPWTPSLLFGLPVFNLNNNVTDLEVLTCDREFRQLARDIRSMERIEDAVPLLDAFFLKKLALKKLETPFLAFAVQQIFQTNGTTSIESLRQNIQASRRYVEKLFKKNIGVSPKQYARMIRVKKASILLQHKNFNGQIASVAAKLDYYDQSHFLKDFKMVVGKTPTEFLQFQSKPAMDGMEEYLGQWDYS